MATTMDYEKAIRTYVDAKVYDQFFLSTPWLARLQKNSKVGSFGRKVEELLETDTNNAQAYSDLDVINRQRAEIVAQAYYPAKYYEADLTISHQEDLAATSPEKKVDLLKTKKNNAMKALRKQLTTDSISGSGGKSLVGLSTIISESTGETVGEIDSSTDTFWECNQDDVSGSITIPKIIDFAAVCADGPDVPTLLATDKRIWAYIWGRLLQPQERYTQGKFNMATDLPSVAGFPMLWDAGFESTYGGGSTGGNIYFINENYLFMRIHKNDNFKRWPTQKPVNQFAYSTYWTITCAMVCTNRARQGVLYNVTT